MNKIKILFVMLLLSSCGKNEQTLETFRLYDDRENLLQKPINVVNLWATWCEPCRQEIPELSKFATQNPDIGVVGIAFDSHDNVQKFLQTTPVAYPIRYVAEDATAAMLKYGNTTGGIPYTLIIAPDCNYQKSRFGAVTMNDLQSSIESAKKACRHQ